MQYLLFASSSLADILMLNVNRASDLSVTSLRFGLVTRCKNQDRNSSVFNDAATGLTVHFL